MKFLRLLIPPVCCGILIAISWIPLSILPFIFFVFFPLFQPNSFFKGKTYYSGNKYFVLQLFIFHLVWINISLHWLFKSALPIGIAAAGVYLVPFLVLFYPYNFIRRNLGLNVAYLYFVAAWVCFEYLSSRWELGSPFLSLGYSLAPYPFLYQWYEYTGVLGGSLWILAVNFLIIITYKAFKETKTNKNKLLFTSILVLCVPILISVLMLRFSPEKGENAEVVVIHPNTDNFNKKYDADIYELINEYTELTNRVITPKTNYAVWPETAITNAGWVKELNIFPVFDSIRNQIEFMAPDFQLISGAIGFEFFPSGTSGTQDVQMRNNPVFKYSSFFNGYYKTFNAALSINGKKSVPVRFKTKDKLVPFQECTPYPEILNFTQRFLKPLGKDFQFSSFEAPVKRKSTWKVSPVICYESAFGRYTSRFTEKGAQALAVILNEGWYNSLFASKQFLYISCVRAVETKRYISRASNGGISGFVNQKGKTYQITSKSAPTALKSMIKLNPVPSFYSKHGDYIGIIAMITIIFILGYLLYNKTKSS